jgi:hypothetical protein
MDIQPPDMGWLSVMKKTNPLWGYEISTLRICKWSFNFVLESYPQRTYGVKKDMRIIFRAW